MCLSPAGGTIAGRPMLRRSAVRAARALEDSCPFASRVARGNVLEPCPGTIAHRAMVRPAGLEPATYGFEVRRSIQLSYGRTKAKHNATTAHHAS